MPNASKLNKTLSPAELLDIAVGYQKSQTLFTFAELKIADLLSVKKLNAKELAKKLKIHPLATERFLNAAVAVGLLTKSGDFYENSQLSANFLVEKQREKYLGGQMKRYQKRSFSQWENLTEHLQKWEYGETADENPESEDQGADAMEEQHNLALLHGYALAEHFDFTNFKHLLDLGGGTGAMSIALCEKIPHLNATVFDLPETIEKAEEMIRRKKLQKRIKCVGGDVSKDDLPKDFDVALLANLLAVFDEKTNKNLFSKIHKNLPPGGASLISGWILDERHTSPEISVLFCLEDICWNAPDVERDFSVYKNWLKNAGFQKISQKTYFEPTKLISAFKK